MLRASNRQQVVDVLEGSYFGTDNYSAEFPTDGEWLFKLTFIPSSQFTFSAKPPDNLGVVVTWECPSIAFVKSESFTSKSWPDTLDRLLAWTDRIKEEVISANPFSRELSQLKGEIDRRLASMQVDLDGFFTATEAAELAARLSKLEERLVEITAENEELAGTITTLGKTVTDLQSALGSVNRGTWFRMSASRLLSGLKAVATSKEGRELALEAAKKFLLEGPK